MRKNEKNTFTFICRHRSLVFPSFLFLGALCPSPLDARVSLYSFSKSVRELASLWGPWYHQLASTPTSTSGWRMTWMKNQLEMATVNLKWNLQLQGRCKTRGSMRVLKIREILLDCAFEFEENQFKWFAKIGKILRNFRKYSLDYHHHTPLHSPKDSRLEGLKSWKSNTQSTKWCHIWHQRVKLGDTTRKTRWCRDTIFIAYQKWNFLGKNYLQVIPSLCYHWRNLNVLKYLITWLQ